MTTGFVRSLLSLVMAVGLSAATSQARGEIKQQKGELSKLIAELASTKYVLGEPATDDRPYADPEAALHDFRHLATELAAGDVDQASEMAGKLAYEVVAFVDVPTNTRYFVLREDLAAVKTLRGWGSYIINPASRIDALVEVPHPFADAYTPEIGGIVFAECGAKGFLLSGAHRAKADVPDLVDSIFHQVHTAWVGPAAKTAAWQIHGFSSINHAFPRGAQVIASTGDGEIVPEIAALDARLEKQGLVSYVFNELPPEAKANKRLNGDVPGVTFTSLAACKNEQGRYSRSVGGSFVHVELEGGIRSDAASRRRASLAIAAVIADKARPSANGNQSAARSVAAAAADKKSAKDAAVARPVIETAAADKSAPAAAKSKPAGVAAETPLTALADQEIRR